MQWHSASCHTHAHIHIPLSLSTYLPASLRLALSPSQAHSHIDWAGPRAQSSIVLGDLTQPGLAVVPHLRRHLCLCLSRFSTSIHPRAPSPTSSLPHYRQLFIPRPLPTFLAPTVPFPPLPSPPPRPPSSLSRATKTPPILPLDFLFVSPDTLGFAIFVRIVLVSVVHSPTSLVRSRQPTSPLVS